MATKILFQTVLFTMAIHIVFKNAFVTSQRKYILSIDKLLKKANIHYALTLM